MGRLIPTWLCISGLLDHELEWWCLDEINKLFRNKAPIAPIIIKRNFEAVLAADPPRSPLLLLYGKFILFYYLLYCDMWLGSTCIRILEGSNDVEKICEAEYYGKLLLRSMLVIVATFPTLFCCIF